MNTAVTVNTTAEVTLDQHEVVEIIQQVDSSVLTSELRRRKEHDPAQAIRQIVAANMGLGELISDDLVKSYINELFK